MIKIFLFPQNMVRADEMNGFFGGLYRCGSAASGVSDLTSVGVEKTVRANSIILHTLGNGKCTGSDAQGAAASSYCNLGANENSRFRLGKENF
jgi:hypothetical protein